MNKIILFAFMMICVIATVSSVSPPYCPDLKCNDTEVCKSLSCSCGAYRPACTCCDECYTCPGEDCSLIPPTVCSNGACKLRDGLSSAQALSSRGPHGKCP